MSRYSAQRLVRQRRPGSCRAAIPDSYCTVPIANSSYPTRFNAALWISRVWPGALLVEGETVGIWRRAGHMLTIQPWQRLSQAQRQAVEAEAASLPLPGIARPIDVRWDHH
jgi:winged helix DNA-binding protein